MVINKLKHCYVNKADGEQKNTSFFVVGQTIHDLDTNWCCQQPSDRGRLMMAIGSTIGKAMGSNLIQPPCTDIVYAFPKASMLPQPTAWDEWLEGCRLIVLNVEYLTACRPCCPRCRKKSVESKGWDVQSSRVQQGEVHTTFVVFREWQCKNPACKKGKFKETNEDLINELPQPLSSLIRHRLRPLSKIAHPQDDNAVWNDPYCGFELGLLHMAKQQSTQHMVTGSTWPPNTPSIPNNLTHVSPSPDSVLPDPMAGVVSAGSTSPEGSGHALGPQETVNGMTVPSSSVNPHPTHATAAGSMAASTDAHASNLTRVGTFAPQLMLTHKQPPAADSDMADAALALQALSCCLLQPGSGAAQPSAATWASWHNMLQTAGLTLTAPNSNQVLNLSAPVAPSQPMKASSTTPTPDIPMGCTPATSSPPLANTNTANNTNWPDAQMSCKDAALMLPHSELQLRAPPQSVVTPVAHSEPTHQPVPADGPLKPLSQNTGRLGVSHGAVQKVTSKLPHSGMVPRRCTPPSAGRVTLPSGLMTTGVVPSRSDMPTPSYTMGEPCDLSGQTPQVPPAPSHGLSLPAHCGAAGVACGPAALMATDWLAAMHAMQPSALNGMLLPSTSGLMLRPSHESPAHASSYLFNMCMSAPHLWNAQPTQPVQNDLPCPR